MGIYNILFMMDSFDQFGLFMMIMSEYLVFKIKINILFLNKVIKLLKLLIKEFGCRM